jgi:hypothetical protein
LKRVAPLPQSRPLTIVAQDPGVESRGRILRATVDVPWEPLAPGPRGHRVHVIDYDASTDTLYRAASVDGDDFVNASDDRLLADPAFHAQNVYAIVMRTLARFEHALGRRVPWGFRSHQLKVAPHAFADANAFYAEREEALAFGYFASRSGRGERRLVYTCLSHDVVAHETTHALLDGARPRFTDPSSPDQAAFHEGFADVVALLSIFALPDVVGALLQRGVSPRTRRRIAAELVDREKLQDTALLGLADQMGAELARVRGDALRRSVKIKPSRDLLAPDGPYAEAHDRGEILVAALLNAFLDAWVGRLRHLGKVAPGQLDLSRVVEDGAEAADTLLTMAIRALDYLPPVDLEFGDYLSALLTADREARPQDPKFHYRRVLRDRCGRYGIDPAPTADPEGCWKAPEDLVYTRAHFEALQRDPEEVFRFVWENRKALRLYEDAFTRVTWVRPVLRIAADGFTLRETVAEYTQQLDLQPAELRSLGIEKPAGMPNDERTISLFGGGTLVFDEYGRLKFHVTNSITNAPKQTARLAYLWEHGYFRPGGTRLAGFANLHRLRSIPMRTVGEAW